MSQTSKPLATIRRAHVRDAALLADLGARTFSDTYGADNTPEDIAAYLANSFGIAQQEAELVDPLATFFIAEVEGAAAGYAKLRAGDAQPGITGSKPIEQSRTLHFVFYDSFTPRIDGNLECGRRGAAWKVCC